VTAETIGVETAEGPAPFRTCRRVVVSRHGGPEVLQVVTGPMPSPGPGGVLVRVEAAGVSAYDLMFRRSGRLPGTPRTPFTPGEDVVGIVDAVGEGVTSLVPGQRVAGATVCLAVGGGYTEAIALPASELVPVPAHVDPAEAVCLVINYLTAAAVMHRTAGVRSGERILVQGAAGGVGSALLDLARLAGLDSYGTASPEKHEVVASFGATPIDYHANVVARIRKLTVDGVDAVFDPIGGARQLWRSYRCLRPGGRLVWFGVAGAKQSGLRIIPISLATRLLLRLLPDGRRALTSDDFLADKAWTRQTLAWLLGELTAGRLTPLVSARLPLHRPPGDVPVVQRHDTRLGARRSIDGSPEPTRRRGCLSMEGRHRRAPRSRSTGRSTTSVSRRWAGVVGSTVDHGVPSGSLVGASSATGAWDMAPWPATQPASRVEGRCRASRRDRRGPPGRSDPTYGRRAPGISVRVRRPSAARHTVGQTRCWSRGRPPGPAARG
jgi:NADPH:quinone reductase-like Zn-dependent oxidoreductase